MASQDDTAGAGGADPAPPSQEVELEAALDAIRRLSAERSGLSMPPPPAARPKRVPQEPGRSGALVLTPDCRVADRDAPLGTLPLRRPVSGSGAGRDDDAVLRALVAEMVREELRGALGQSLTGTVRKIVRQEVGRILAERDLG